MSTEIFATPCVGAIIERIIDNEKYILLQTRQKPNGNETNGKIEIPAGKIREYEEMLSALRREVYEETGLRITKIHGEDLTVVSQFGRVSTISLTPFCITQNLSGAYSIILNTFVCETDGEPLKSTDETEDIKWVSIAEVKRLIEIEPDRVFFMHVNALKKYLNM